MKGTLPPVYLFVAILLMAAAHFLVPLATLIPFPWTISGLLPLAAGVGLILAADRQFKQFKTTVKPFEVSSALITAGVFRWSRNPMYLGMVLTVAGIAVFVGSATPWIVVVLIAVLLHRRFVLVEERMLAETFGAQFETYKRSVRRWLRAMPAWHIPAGMFFAAMPATPARGDP